MLNNILTETILDCTGCGACNAICPVSAIEIRLNKEGFLSPHVNERCINCGLCQQVCYKFADTTCMPIMQDKKVYGCHSVDVSIHRSTTSGGFAYELSRWGIEHGYKVFGTIYDYDKDMARCVIVDNIDELEPLKGSKYIQSDMSEASKMFLAAAMASPTQKYICIGTPCQIFGLRRLIDMKRLSNEIILVDLFCHGVPSYLVWQPYIKTLKTKLGNIRNVQFRYKGNGWHQYSIRVTGDRKTYTRSAYSDIFYRYFFDNVVLNSSCFNCSLRKCYSAADLRLGDFLGQVYEHREDGVSAVLAVTKRGNELINKLSNEGLVHIDNVFDAAICLKYQSTHDYSNKKLRDLVISMLHTESIQNTQKYYLSVLPIKSKIYAYMKYIVSMFPSNIIICIRRVIRKVK